MLKFNTADGKEITLGEIEVPKNVKEVQPEGLRNAARVTGNKGENSVSKFYGYYFLDKYAVVTAKINGNDQPYDACICILIDLTTHKPFKAGTVSLSSFIRNNMCYSDPETMQVKECQPQFVDVIPFRDSPDGILDYYKKNFVGKCFIPTGNEYDMVRPIFDNGVPIYSTPEGKPLPIRKLPEFKEADFQIAFE